MEARVKEELPLALLDRGVQFHTRKGIRPDCECNFCRLKASSWSRFRWNAVLKDIRQYMVVDGESDWDYQVWMARKRIRLRFRKELNEAKQ